LNGPICTVDTFVRYVYVNFICQNKLQLNSCSVQPQLTTMPHTHNYVFQLLQWPPGNILRSAARHQLAVPSQ